MNKITQAITEIREIDELAAKDTPVHRFSALSKFLVTIFYIAFVMSFHKYDLTRMVPMILYPVFMFQLCEIPFRLCLYKMRFILPFVLMVGLFNPLFDHTPVMLIGSFVITGGWISLFTLMLKGILALSASFLLIATTKIEDICAALHTLHIPDILVTMFLLTYRYIFIMMDEVSIMTTAYHLRAPHQKGIAFQAWGSFLGQLLLRSMDKAERIFHSMRLRGYENCIYLTKKSKLYRKDILFLIITVSFMIITRLFNIPVMIGNLF